jgi:cytochrome c oxidase cbb3-type subunit III
MRILSLLLVGVAGAANACGGSAEAAQPTVLSQSGALAFVAHPDNIQPGLGARGRFATLTNPYEGNAQRIAEGAKLFISYNCMDCHGADGSGAMGPSLQDGRWHFGGSAAEVFESIYEGRPDGMPAWGGRIPEADVWRLVSYIRTLSKGHDVATENFTGKTVERSGR